MRLAQTVALFLAVLTLARWIAGPARPAEMTAITDAAWTRERARQGVPAERNALNELMALASLPAAQTIQRRFYQNLPLRNEDARAFLALEPRLERALARPILAPPNVLGQTNLSTPAHQASVLLSSVYHVLVEQPEYSQNAARKLVRLSALASGLGSIPSVMSPSRDLEHALVPLQRQVGAGAMSRMELEELRTFLAANRLAPARMVEATDDYMVLMSERVRMPGYGSGLAPQAGGYRVPPGLLQFYFDRRQRQAEQAYIAMRPSLQSLEPYPAAESYDSLRKLERMKARYRTALDRYAILEASVALQLDSESSFPEHPRITYDRAKRTLKYAGRDALEPVPTEYLLNPLQ